MKLMKDTCSLMNYMMVNDNLNVKVGDSFAELFWSDRSLYQVVRIEDKKIIARRVQTEMKDGWEDGTQYPKTDENGNWLLCGEECVITKPRKYWKKNGYTTHLSWGAKTGYRDPHF